MSATFAFLGREIDVALVQETARAAKRKLTPAKIEGLTGPKFYGDGGNLWLQVAPAGGRSWVFRYTVDGRALVMGLGSAQDVSLTEARARAILCRRLLREGLDPREERERWEAEQGLARKVEARRKVSLHAAYLEYVATHRVGDEVRREPHRWGYSLNKNIVSAHGSKLVTDIDDDAVADMLRPIWKAKPEVAKKARRELAQILDFAKAKKWRSGENPARAVGELKLQLGQVLRSDDHHDALPYSEMPGFWSALVKREEVAALALQFTILTASRTVETVGARWAEIDPIAKVWTVPAERMKGRKEHRVALSDAALAVLTHVTPLGAEFVFPGYRKGQPLSRAAMEAVLKRMGRKDGVTVHGFRSTFSDWAWEVMHDRDTASAALAHVVGDRVERAYRRSDALEKRRGLMEAWSAYCAGKSPSNIEGGDGTR